jgi:HEAT repeat protein
MPFRGRSSRRKSVEADTDKAKVPTDPSGWILDEAETLRLALDNHVRLGAAQKLADACSEIASGNTLYVGTEALFAGSLSLVLYRDSSPSVREIAASAFAVLGPVAILHAEALAAALLNDSAKQVKIAAARALASVGKEADAFPQSDALRHASLHDGDLAVRQEAAKCLGLLDRSSSPHLDELVNVMTSDKDQVLRSRAAAALGSVGKASEVHSEALARVSLDDKAAGVRIAAATALRTLGEAAPSDGLSQLVIALEDRSPERRKAAAKALGAIGYAPPIEEQKDGLCAEAMHQAGFDQSKGKKKKKKSQRASSTSPTRPTESSTSPTAHPKDPSMTEDKAVAGDRGQMVKQSQSEGSSHVPKRGKARKKSPQRSRASAVECFLEPQPPPKETAAAVQLRAGRALASASLNDSDAFVRYWAGEAMNTFGNAVKDEVDAMATSTMQHNDAEVRDRASEALGTLGDSRESHASTFASLMRNRSDPIIQSRALYAIRNLGTAARPHRKALDTVIRESTDASIRSAARNTLGFLQSRPLGAFGRRLVSEQPEHFKSAELQTSMSDLRMSAADMQIKARCSTPARYRSESVLLLKAKMIA